PSRTLHLIGEVARSASIVEQGTRLLSCMLLNHLALAHQCPLAHYLIETIDQPLRGIGMRDVFLGLVIWSDRRTIWNILCESQTAILTFEHSKLFSANRMVLRF